MVRLNLNKTSYFKKQIVLLLIVVVSSFSGYAQNSMERKQLFDYDWKFFLGDASEAKATDFNDESWRKLDLPHDWSIEGKIHPKNPTGGGGGYFPAGIGWYRKTFQAPPSWKGKRVCLEFDGVSGETTVYLNGQKLGVHPYAYTSFRFDITSRLNPAAKNLL